MSNVRATAWSVTINNPTAKDEEEIALARQKGWSVEGQKEVGDSGTLHYQLFVKTPQVRFSAIKKAFSRAHIEIARNPSALVNYVHKEETRVGQLQVSQDQYPSLSKLWELIYNWLTEVHGVEVTHEAVKGHAIWKKDKLEIFDNFIGDMIVAGYHVESIGVNPQVRSAWKSYATHLLIREHRSRSIKNEDADKDRQTDKDDDVASEENVSST